MKRRSKIRDLPHGIGQPFDTRPVQHPIAVHLAVPWLLSFQFLVIRYLETISRVILRVYTTGHSVVACQPTRRYLRLCKATFVWGCCACSWQQSVIIATTCRAYDLPCVPSFLWSASFYYHAAAHLRAESRDEFLMQAEISPAVTMAGFTVMRSSRHAYRDTRIYNTCVPSYAPSWTSPFILRYFCEKMSFTWLKIKEAWRYQSRDIEPQSFHIQHVICVWKRGQANIPIYCGENLLWNCSETNIRCETVWDILYWKMVRSSDIEVGMSSLKLSIFNA